MYEMAFGADDGTFIAITGDPSMSAIDTGFAEDKKFREAIGGDEGMRKLDELFGEAVCLFSQRALHRESQAELRQPDDWIKSDPDFWKPKPASMSPQPSQPQPQKAWAVTIPRQPTRRFIRTAPRPAEPFLLLRSSSGSVN